MTGQSTLPSTHLPRVESPLSNINPTWLISAFYDATASWNSQLPGFSQAKQCSKVVRAVYTQVSSQQRAQPLSSEQCGKLQLTRHCCLTVSLWDTLFLWLWIHLSAEFLLLVKYFCKGQKGTVMTKKLLYPQELVSFSSTQTKLLKKTMVGRANAWYWEAG